MPITTHASEIPVPPETKIWRYLEHEKFISLLEERALFFCRTDKFPDPFEGSVPFKEYDYRRYYDEEENLTDEAREIRNSNHAGLTRVHLGFTRATIVNC